MTTLNGVDANGFDADGFTANTCLLGTNEVLVADDIVTTDEQRALLDWAEAQYQGSKLLSSPSDPGSYCTPFHSEERRLTRFTNVTARRSRLAEQELIWVPEVDDQAVDLLPDEFWRIRTRVVDRLGLAHLEEDHYKGSFLSYIAPGTGVHAHRDARLTINGEERPILRCNVLFRRPSEGGLPVVDQKELDVPDRGMWAFFPSEQVHSASTVRGGWFRGLLSFGFLVHFHELWQRRFQIAPEFEREFGLDGNHEGRRTLLDQLKEAPQSQSVARERIELLEYILMRAGHFSVDEAAESLQQRPADTWQALSDLQRSGVVQSFSSTRADWGHVAIV